jgi:SAM-dependent methyltransferase/glycosyltransferase involved in cell wall biosynthesis
MLDLEFTGERVVPDKVEPELFLEHVSRYHFAARFIRGRDVLDFGCGAGYGAAILERAGARRVVGSDLSPAAIHYARSRYDDPALAFCVTDCEASCFPSASFDVVVSFELIEHLASHRLFLTEVRRILRPGGLFLVSTPNKATYRSEPGTPANPFHLRELELDELRRTLHDVFPCVTILGQSRTEGVLFHRRSEATGQSERRAVLTAKAPEAEDLFATAAFFLALCGDDPATIDPSDVDLFEVADTNAVRSRDRRILALQDELEERTRWARSLEEESSRRGQRVLQLEEELLQRRNHRDAMNGPLDARSRDTREQYDQLEERLRRLECSEGESGQRRRQLVELEAEVHRISASLEQLRALGDRLSERLGNGERDLRQELDDLRIELADQRRCQRERSELQHWHRESLLRHGSELERHERALAQSTEENDRHERVLAEHDESLSRFELSLHALSQSADHYRDELVRWTRWAREVESSAVRAQDLIGLLWGSRSWRLYARLVRAVEALVPRRLLFRRSPLVDAPPPEVSSGGRSRALVIDHRLPTPDRDAGSVRMVELVRQLQRLGFAVTFLPHNLYSMPPYDEQLRALGVELIVAPPMTSVSRYLAEEGGSFQLALVSRLHIATSCIDSVRELCSNAKLVFDTVDLQYLRLEREARLHHDSALTAKAGRVKAQELGIAARADATLVVSDVERDLLRREVPGLAVHRISMIEHIQDEVPDFESRKGLFFVGGFEHPPNVDAVLWFAADVFPEVRRHLPDATFFVLGSQIPEEIHALASAGIAVCGQVPEMQRFLRGCRLSVAPLRYGAGIKGKVTQSLAWGLPCVMTRVAAEGIDLSHGRDALITDDPMDFARCVVDLYRDRELWERVSVSGRQRIRERFSPDVACVALRTLFDELGLEQEAAARA